MTVDPVGARTARIASDFSPRVLASVGQSRPTRATRAFSMSTVYLDRLGETLASRQAIPYKKHRDLPDYRGTQDEVRIHLFYDCRRVRSADPTSLRKPSPYCSIDSGDRTDTAVHRRRSQGMANPRAGNGPEQSWGQNGPQQVKSPGFTRDDGPRTHQEGKVFPPLVPWFFGPSARPGRP